MWESTGLDESHAYALDKGQGMLSSYERSVAIFAILVAHPLIALSDCECQGLVSLSPHRRC